MQLSNTINACVVGCKHKQLHLSLTKDLMALEQTSIWTKSFHAFNTLRLLPIPPHLLSVHSDRGTSY